DGWLHLKLLLVLGMAATHGALVRYQKAFAADQRPGSGRFFRWLNELPTLLFVAIVVVAVFRPF
ncbi:MAG: CopD family protein, partial [Pseudomonadota bacterium]